MHALAMLAAVLSGSVAAAPNTTIAANASAYNISMGLIWDSIDAEIEVQKQFTQILLPLVRKDCPDSPKHAETNFGLYMYTLDSLITLTDLISVSNSLKSANNLFLGIKKSGLTVMLENLAPATTVPGYPKLQIHAIAPMPQQYLEDALLKVFNQLTQESLYPNSTQNKCAAFIIDQSVDMGKMTRVFEAFSKGVIVFSYSPEQLESNLLHIKKLDIVNIIVLMDSVHDDFLKLTAFRLDMLASKYRWIIHGLRLINWAFDSRMTVYSSNITSIEFGRVLDTLQQDLRTDTSVFINDLISVWRFYLRNYLCNETAPVNATYNGFTGQFSLSPNGTVKRTSWSMQIYRGLDLNKQHIGRWSSDDSFDMLRWPDKPRTANLSMQELRYNPFRVVTLISPPFVMYKPGVPKTAPLSEQLTGMYPEICKLLLKRLGISNYEFFLQPDGASGALLDNGTWNGMVGTVGDGKAHLGCNPITIQAIRKQVVRFSQVIHAAPLSLLYKKATTSPTTQLFHFLLPLDASVWLGLVGLLLFTAAVLTALNRLEPDPELNLGPYNSVFFCFAEAVQGTTDLVPKHLPSRIVVCCFWFATLFLFLGYVANSAAFRVLEVVTQQPDSMETLVRSDKFEFCVVQNGGIQVMMNASVNAYTQYAYALMSERFANGFVDSVTTAVSIMLNSSTSFALITDSLQNAYLRDTSCGLTNAGSFYWLKFALIMPLDSEYGAQFDTEIVNMADQISVMQKQFLDLAVKDKPDCSDSNLLSTLLTRLPSEPWQVRTGSMSLPDTLGITIINICGCCLALVMSAIEFGWGRLLKRRSSDRRNQQTSRAFEMSQPHMRKRE